MALQTPSPTLYISNLEPKIKKPELKAQLYSLFNPYGHIIDIVAKKNGGMRGQAHVVFAEQAAATAAMRGLTGESFWNRDLRITYSTSPSSATLARTDPSASREAAAIKAAKLVVSRAQGEYEAMEKEREEGEGKKRVLDGGDEPNAKRIKGEDGDDEEMEIEMEDDEDDAPQANGGGATLLCTNLPPECTDEIMGALFGQYAGYSKTAPLPPSTASPPGHPSPNPGAKSFRVTFSSRSQAEAAIGPTKGFLMQPGWEMGVSLE